MSTGMVPGDGAAASPDEHREPARDRSATDGVSGGAPVRRPYRGVTRAIDVVVGVAGLLLAAPVMLVVALAVRLETGPGVIVEQKRIAGDGRVVTLYRFRSRGPVDGTRLGPVGRFLGWTCLDELPQLVNVICGQLSLVSPRA